MITRIQPWHTEGYLKLADALNYLFNEWRKNRKTWDELELAIPVLRDCGIQIKNEVDRAK